MLPFSEACERNKIPILGVLRSAFITSREVLEIGSGTGQHAVYFAGALPHLTWHPTERAENLRNLGQRIAQHTLPNLRAAEELDVLSPAWPPYRVDAIFSANTLHIMSWDAVDALFAGVGRVLAPGGQLGLYGPFNVEGTYTSPSNARFDSLLRARDPLSGIRELSAVVALATREGLTLTQDHPMPANNRLLVFSRGT